MVKGIKRRRAVWGLIILFVIIATVVVWRLPARSNLSPYPPSLVIHGVTWDTASIITAAPGSDLWPMTWAADGHLYTSWGDGGGFGGTNVAGRVSMGFARLEGTPPNFRTVNVNGGVNSENPPRWGCTDCGKAAGLLAIDGVIYAWVNEQAGNPPSVRLYWSKDLAATWSSAKWAFPDRADPRFFPATFANFGQDYANARDAHVYMYGWTLGRRDDIYLARSMKSEITNRARYEFFAGVDSTGSAVWNKDARRGQPIFSDPNGVGLAAVVYHPRLKRYILTTSHRKSSPPPPTNLGCLGIFDAPEPWGPWTTIAYYDDWLGLTGEGLNYDIPTKWFGADGKTFWMVYSGPDADRFNLIKGTLVLGTSP